MAKLLISLVGLLLVTAACTAGEDTTPTPVIDEDVRGVLAGSVTIGPLCPIEPCGESPGDVYSSRELVLQRPGGVLLNVLLRPDGTFEGVVPIGTYEIHLDRCEYLGCQSVFPLSVEIRDGETSTLNIDIDTGIRSVVGASEAYRLSEELRAAGASVDVGGPIGQSFFSTPGQLLTVNGIEIQVYVYPGPEEASRDASQVSPDGGTVGLTSIMWVATPHSYLEGALMVLYLGDDAPVQTLLEGVLGLQFAGGGQAVPGPTPSGVVPAEEAFKALLTLFDVEKLLTTAVRLNTDVTDFKAMAEVVDPAQVKNMDSFYVLSFQTEDRMKGMTFSAIDFDSEASAQGHFETVKTETPGLQDMDSPIGDASVEVEVSAQGIGSVLVFIQGDVLVMLHTAQPDDQEPLLSLAGLDELAKLVASRLTA